MENLTHSLVGVAIGDALAGPAVSSADRTRYRIAGLVAANLPDIDLVYSWILPNPVGYLLHHRGHTHTLAALIVMWALMIAYYHMRSKPDQRTSGFLTVTGLGLLSHVLADGLNTYGVHPFWPFDNAWYYGDAIFIFEPWLWMLLGVPVAMNTSRKWIRISLTAVLAVLAIAAGVLGIVGPIALGILVATGGALAWLIRNRGQQFRAVVSLAGVTALVLASVGLREVARITLLRTTSSVGDTRVEEVLNPLPANPLCWTAIRISHVTGNDFLSYQGSTVDLGEVIGARACNAQTRESSRFQEFQPVAQIRELAASDCHVRAWLRFARVPKYQNGSLVDLRFEETGRGNFTAMFPERGRACPGYIPPWDPPTIDGG